MRSTKRSTFNAMEAERRRREPVWLALSTLWLDTELQAHDLREIARVLHASGYDLATLHGIYRCEVAPVVYRNLLTPAGVWDGFDETWLCDKAARHARRRSRWHDARWRLFAPVTTYATAEPWRRVVALLKDVDAR